jgi:cyclic pyranopterin phosphate synthase
MSVRDALGRPLGSLRLSVTDRCNLRCRYCMPESEYVWLPRESILSFEELTRLAGVFASLGARKVRLTGGEPLLRQELERLVAQLAATPAIAETALTTNGLLLARHAESLRAAGLGRITVSLDTLRAERMLAFARSPHHADVLAGIAAAAAAGFTSTKLNTVVIRGFNDDEVVPILEFARERGLEVRFIEYMDVGGATGWDMSQVVSRAEMLDAIGRRHGEVTPLSEPGSRAPAERFALRDGTTFGIIASTTAPFCRSCDRSRITADGTWFLCLYGEQGVDLRTPLRAGASDADLAALIRTAWTARTDRGAELRAELPERGALYAIEGLRADPRREMHTRGG